MEDQSLFPLIAEEGAVEFIGATLLGPAPFWQVHLPFTGAVGALYGKNGVGKTRLLSAISDAANGIARDDQIGLVHFRLSDPEDVVSTDWLSNLGELAERNFYRIRGEIDPQEEEDLAERLRDALLIDIANETLAHHRYAYLPDDAPISDFELMQITLDGHFTAMATGTVSNPRWKIFTSILPTDPRFMRFIYSSAALREAQMSHQELVEALGDDRIKALDRYMKAAKAQRPIGFVEWPWDQAGAFDPNFEASGHPRARSVWDSSWAPLPLALLATVSDLPFTVFTPETSQEELDNATVERVLATAKPKTLEDLFHEKGPKITADPAGVNLPGDVAGPLKALEDRARDYYNRLAYRKESGETRDELIFHLGNVTTLLEGVPPHWALKVAGAKEPVPVTGLSKAQQRWMRQAVGHALANNARPALMLIDEPEEGVHRSLEVQLPEVLEWIAKESNSLTLCATHSPALLSGKISLFHIHKEEVVSAVSQSTLNLSQVGKDLEVQAELYGVTLPDLLQLVDGFILVEGAHDQIVFETLFEDDLQAHSIRVLPMRGAKQARSAISADLLLNYTTAKVVIVLDNLAATRVKEIWSDVKSIAEESNAGKAKQRMRDHFKEFDGGEASWLREALEYAIDNHAWDRVTPVGLSKKDIPLYLPLEAFKANPSVDASRGWGPLIQRFQRSGSHLDLKAWLKENYGILINNRNVENAAQYMLKHKIEVNPELTSVLETVGIPLDPRNNALKA